MSEMRCKKKKKSKEIRTQMASPTKWLKCKYDFLALTGQNVSHQKQIDSGAGYCELY